MRARRGRLPHGQERAAALSAPYDAIILGAGAAGLFCAGVAAQRGKRVLVLERNAEPGAKILISGGGRCNFTNLHGADASRYLSANPDFARSALARYRPGDFLALIEKHGIAYYEKTLGQLFCEGAGSARKIARLLLDEADGAQIRTGCNVGAVTFGRYFRVETDQGAFEARALVLASGGLSIPKLGASDLAFRVAAQFGLPLIAPRPALVPLTFAEPDLAWMRPLAGVSTAVTAEAGGQRFREAALFTHRGLSGPAILQASSYINEVRAALTIDWLPDETEDALVAAKRRQPGALAKTALTGRLPERLAAALTSGQPPRPLGDWKDEALRAFIKSLKNTPLKPAGTEGYAKAEVTAGGVSTAALSQRTMEARQAPGLYVIGEAVDVTGWLGGYNFQWAWASGRAAGLAIP